MARKDPIHKILVAIVALWIPLIIDSHPAPAEEIPRDRAPRHERTEERHLHLSMRIAEANRKESSKMYYQSLVRRQKWRTVRLPQPR